MLSLSPTEMEAIVLSLRVAFFAVMFSLPLGIATAWVLASCQFPGKFLFDAIVHLPMILPPVVVGYLLLIFMGRNGFMGEILEDTFGISFAFRWQGAALASAIMAFPLMVRAIRLSMEGIDSGLYAVAHTLGANRLRVFLTITAPLAMPGIITGSVLSFARSLGEFGATIAFVSNIPGETRTIPLALYTLINTPGGDSGALRLVVAAIGLSLLALVLSEALSRNMATRKTKPRP